MYSLWYKKPFWKVPSKALGFSPFFHGFGSGSGPVLHMQIRIQLIKISADPWPVISFLQEIRVAFLYTLLAIWIDLQRSLCSTAPTPSSWRISWRRCRSWVSPMFLHASGASADTFRQSFRYLQIYSRLLPLPSVSQSALSFGTVFSLTKNIHVLFFRLCFIFLIRPPSSRRNLQPSKFLAVVKHLISPFVWINIDVCEKFHTLSLPSMTSSVKRSGVNE